MNIVYILIIIFKIFVIVVMSVEVIGVNFEWFIKSWLYCKSFYIWEWVDEVLDFKFMC